MECQNFSKKFQLLAKVQFISYLLLTAAALAEINSYKLHHVGFEQIDIPPRGFFHLSETASGQVEKCARASVYCFLRNPSLRYARLHRGFSGSNVQD